MKLYIHEPINASIVSKLVGKFFDMLGEYFKDEDGVSVGDKFNIEFKLGKNDWDADTNLLAKCRVTAAGDEYFLADVDFRLVNGSSSKHVTDFKFPYSSEGKFNNKLERTFRDEMSKVVESFASGSSTPTVEEWRIVSSYDIRRRTRTRVVSNSYRR